MKIPWLVTYKNHLTEEKKNLRGTIWLSHCAACKETFRHPDMPFKWHLNLGKVTKCFGTLQKRIFLRFAKVVSSFKTYVTSLHQPNCFLKVPISLIFWAKSGSRHTASPQIFLTVLNFDVSTNILGLKWATYGTRGGFHQWIFRKKSTKQLFLYFRSLLLIAMKCPICHSEGQ